MSAAILCLTVWAGLTSATTSACVARSAYVYYVYAGTTNYI